MSTPKTKPAPTRSAKGKGKAPTVEMVQISLPKPLPKGVSVVYDEKYNEFYIKTSSMKATRALLEAVCAATKR